MRESDCTILVDDKKGRTLAQRQDPALDVIPIVHSMIFVNQAGERQLVALKIGPGHGHRLVSDRHDFAFQGLESLVIPAQLSQVSPAEWSLKPSKKNQDHGLALPEIGKRHRAPVDGW